MPVLNISDPETKKDQRVELEEERMSSLIGIKIGEVIEGSIVNLSGHKIRLTGGTDKDGIPMRPDVHGSVKARIILSSGVGYKPRKRGERKRILVRGNTVSADTTFLNFKIEEKPKKGKRKEKKQEKQKKKGKE